MDEKDERWEQVEEGVELLEVGDAERAVEELLRVATDHPDMHDVRALADRVREVIRPAVEAEAAQPVPAN